MLGNTAPQKELDSRKTSVIPSTVIEILELTPNEVGPIVDSWLEHDKKILQISQRQQLDSAANSGLNPLFLRLLYPMRSCAMFFFFEPNRYDRASKWRSFSKIEPLENSVADLINAFLNRLETYHGSLLVTHVFGLLGASKYIFLEK